MVSTLAQPAEKAPTYEVPDLLDGRSVFNISDSVFRKHQILLGDGGNMLAQETVQVSPDAVTASDTVLMQGEMGVQYTWQHTHVDVGTRTRTVVRMVVDADGYVQGCRATLNAQGGLMHEDKMEPDELLGAWNEITRLRRSRTAQKMVHHLFEALYQSEHAEDADEKKVTLEDLLDPEVNPLAAKEEVRERIIAAEERRLARKHFARQAFDENGTPNWEVIKQLLPRELTKQLERRNHRIGFTALSLRPPTLDLTQKEPQ